MPILPTYGDTRPSKYRGEWKNRRCRACEAALAKKSAKGRPASELVERLPGGKPREDGPCANPACETTEALVHVGKGENRRCGTYNSHLRNQRRKVVAEADVKEQAPTRKRGAAAEGEGVGCR